MKRLLEIFILILTSLSADSLDTDVNHVIVDHKGNSIIAIIDSIDLDRVYYKIKNDGETSAMDIDKVYFIYNDYDRIYHYDWSYYENLRRIANRTGQIITLDNDSISFTEIQFREFFGYCSATYLKARNQLIKVGLIKQTYRGGGGIWRPRHL